MAFIPPINAPQQTYSRFRRQSKRKALITENISDKKNNDSLPGRRRKGDRRKRNVKVLLDQRKRHNRRIKQFTNRSTTVKDANKAQRKGKIINTTA